MSKADSVRVWDPFVRIFHWTLVAAFTVSYLSEGEPEWLHTWSGYLILILVGLRVVWGLVGTPYARFGSFVRGPVTAARYLVSELVGGARRHLGHNPAGGIMILLILASLIATGFTGMSLLAADEGAGPLAGWIMASESGEELYEELHEFFANFTLFLVIVHVAGVVLGSLRHRENLVASMFHGYKRRELD
ncbi:MAG: cytochrome b/b6 domain-containing protein [Ectothiorhodospiraceae bacterium]|jgi:cytochrome b